jgi:hypothetical protein
LHLERFLCLVYLRLILQAGEVGLLVSLRKQGKIACCYLKSNFNAFTRFLNFVKERI